MQIKLADQTIVLEPCDAEQTLTITELEVKSRGKVRLARVQVVHWDGTVADFLLEARMSPAGRPVLTVIGKQENESEVTKSVAADWH